MKKFLTVLLALLTVLALVGCAAQTNEPAATNPPIEETGTDSAEAVIDHTAYVAAEVDSEVLVETYIQARQGWWEKDGVGGVASFYCQSEDGAYFLYDMPCSKEDYDSALVPGAGIRVKGYKAEWMGEVEIVDATYEMLGQTFVAEPLDATELLGTDALIEHQNARVCFTGLTVEAANDAGDAFLYSWDGSGSDGSDLYFKASYNGSTYTFTVESYLCGAGTEVYEAVKALAVGDVINLEGFLYWYEGMQPHVTAVSK